MDQFKKMIEAEVEQERPLRFMLLPDKLPDARPHVRERYHAARRKMYRAQMEAVMIAAPECWPLEYTAAKREFEEKMLELFSQTCTKYR